MGAQPTIGFLGAGRMATALAKGLLRAGLVQPEGLVASDVDAGARERFAQSTGARVTSRNDEVAEAATLIVAVKPGQVGEVLGGIRNQLTDRHLIISIAAGVSLGSLEAAVPAGVRVARVMPNTPALVGCSASAVAVGSACSEADSRRVQELFASVGVVIGVKEALLDAVTGLSGSGPAYAFLVIEALADGGVAEGLPREVSIRLAAQTLLGAAQMVLGTGEHPAALRDQVASPAGTTIEGLQALERGQVRAGLMEAVRASARRSRELGRPRPS